MEKKLFSCPKKRKKEKKKNNIQIRVKYRENRGQVDESFSSWVQYVYVLQWFDELGCAAFGWTGCGDVAQPARQ